MLLLTGPPGSGKTRRVLEMFRQSAPGARLLVPTATMAEHVRHGLAREGRPIRPSAVQTLAQFIERWTRDLPQVADAVLRCLVEEALGHLSPAAFNAVADRPGFLSAVVDRIEELDSAGCDAARLAGFLRSAPSAWECGPDFQAVYARVETVLRLRGEGTRSARVRLAARRFGGLAGIPRVFVDGFFTFSEAELSLLESLAAHNEMVITLPRWPESERARARLVALGLVERECLPERHEPRRVLVAAPTRERETIEIARRIIELHGELRGAGREFREMGIVVRSRSPYVPALRATLERFRIPARFYFAETLDRQAPVPYLIALVDAMLGGWDYAATLAALRLLPAGPALDALEFRIRERLPGRGLEALAALTTDPELLGRLQAAAELDSLRDGAAEASAWAERAGKLPDLAVAPEIVDGVPHDRVLLWRAQASAIAAFQAAMDLTAAALRDHPPPLRFADFWRHAREALAMTPFRVEDNRRDVVHVMDVYEARQWELPVVFLCGMRNDLFPRRHHQDALLGEETRRLLRRAGIPVRTLAERQQEEEFLFELAAGRATELLVMSYPERNESGEPSLLSPFVEDLIARSPVERADARQARPAPARPRADARLAIIADEELRQWLGGKHQVLTPSSIETFLQCPFQFFARHTLDLAKPPPRPRERLTPLLQGAILHRALAQWGRGAGPLEELFETIFAAECARHGVPAGFHHEAVRRELRRSLGALEREGTPGDAVEVHTELAFTLTLPGGPGIRGRLDRVEILANGRARIIDYKYSRRDRLKQIVEEHEQGRRVQAGLYLLAARDSFRREPQEMLLCGLRREPLREGWSTSADVARLIALAEEKSRAAAAGVGEARIRPAPADEEQCVLCAYRDICRVESQPAAEAAGGQAP